jgi:hypothetical protein
MLSGQEPETKPISLNRKLWLGFSAAAFLLVAYVGWVFYSRWHENSAINEQVKSEEQQKEQKRAADTVETLGGTEFKIISFYASPGLIHPGDEVTMCYGASNAKSVSIDPPVGNVWPSVNRCFQINPKKTTKYVFTADDGKGTQKTAELTIEVK